MRIATSLGRYEFFHVNAKFFFFCSMRTLSASMICAPGACRSSPNARRSSSRSLMVSQCGMPGAGSGSGSTGMAAPRISLNLSPREPTPGVCISMASSGMSALGWCSLAGPPWTLGPASPISRCRRRASSSPCSRIRHRPGREGVRKTRLSPGGGSSLSSSSCSSSSESSCCWKVPGTGSCCVCAGGCGSCSCLCCGPFLCLCLFDPFFPWGMPSQGLPAHRHPDL